jgi:hypothetical protein
MGPDEFNQLLREISIEFFGCARDCQWGGESNVVGL